MSMMKHGLTLLTLSAMALAVPDTAQAQDSEKFIPRPALPSQMREKDSETSQQSEESTGESDQATDPNQEEGSQVSTSEEDSESNSQDDEKSDSDSDKEDEKQDQGLFDGEIVIYPNNIFENKENLKEFVKYIEEETHTKGQFQLQEDEENLMLTVTYADAAKADKQPIVFYGETGFENEEKAKTFIEDALLVYPDLFFQGEPVKAGDKYDIAFGLRPNVNSQAVWYDTEAVQVKYTDKRKPYTYTVKKGEEDKYKPAIEAAFPDIFEFKEEEADGGKKVTMRQIEESRESQQTNEGRSFIKFPTFMQPAVDVLNDLGDMIYDFLDQVGVAHYLDGFNVIGENAWVLSLITICIVLALLLIIF